MAETRVPSLVSLCMGAAKSDLLRCDDLLPDVYELPSVLFDELLVRLPPLALEKLHAAMPAWKLDDEQDVFVLCSESGRKRGRCRNFDRAWRELFKLRWPEIFDQLVQPADWQQMYWETHLQNCLDVAAEKAMLPSFGGRISETFVSDFILDDIGCERSTDSSTSDYSRLCHHCNKFGCYLRSLRLQNVHCVQETSDLFRNCRLESLILRWIRSKEHVDPLSNLLIQNAGTLTSIEFVHCELSAVEAICSSLFLKGVLSHGVKHFYIHGSRFLDQNAATLPNGLILFLSSARSLCSLRLCNNRLDWNFGKLVLKTLLDASSDLGILDLSENNIGGWLSDFQKNFVDGPQSSLADAKSLRSLHVLNLRENNLQKEDMDNLRNALPYIPNLEMLDLSDNPIEDDGVRSVISFFTEASQQRSPLHELILESCDLSVDGVTELLSTISTWKRPLVSLSIADNNLGSQVAAPLRGLIMSGIRVLNIGGIGLGSSGFKELQNITSTDIKLMKINVSKNRGGIEAAKFLSMLVEIAPELTMVDASYNVMPAESLTSLSSIVRFVKGKLELLDLRGNNCGDILDAPELLNLKHKGKPVVISSAAPNFPHDDDP